MEFNLVLIMFMYSLQVPIDLCKYLSFPHLPIIRV